MFRKVERKLQRAHHQLFSNIPGIQLTFLSFTAKFCLEHVQKSGEKTSEGSSPTILKHSWHSTGILLFPLLDFLTRATTAHRKSLAWERINSFAVPNHTGCDFWIF
jgi:hypothetical protein